MTSTSIQIDQARLAKIITLYHGKHDPNGNGHVEAPAIRAQAVRADD